jgi:hypothetical protein
LRDFVQSVRNNYSTEFARTSALLPRVSRSSDDSVGSESGLPIGLIVGVIVGVIVAVIVLICVAIVIVVVISRRRLQLSDESSQTTQSTLHIDFTDDHLGTTNDALAATFSNTLTIEGGCELPASLVSRFAVDINVALLASIEQS